MILLRDSDGVRHEAVHELRPLFLLPQIIQLPFQLIENPNKKMPDFSDELLDTFSLNIKFGVFQRQKSETGFFECEQNVGYFG